MLSSADIGRLKMALDSGWGRMWSMEVLDRGMFKLRSPSMATAFWRDEIRFLKRYGHPAPALAYLPSAVHREAHSLVADEIYRNLRRLLTAEGYRAGFNARPDPARSPVGSLLGVTMRWRRGWLLVGPCDVATLSVSADAGGWVIRRGRVR